MTSSTAVNLRDYIRDIPDFPKPGITFKDITPLLADGNAFAASVSGLACQMPAGVDAVIGIESRGFIFGAALAQQTGLGMILVRKPGKLPADVHGVDRLEIHRDSVSAGHRVVIVDDLLATGGTMRATVELIHKLGAEVAACLFVVELTFLNGRALLRGVPVHSLISYNA